MAAIGQQITEFIVANFLFGDTSRTPEPSDSLVESGVIDSTGVLELIEFLESEFGIKVADAEMVPKNLDTVANLVAFVEAKQAG